MPHDRPTRTTVPTAFNGITFTEGSNQVSQQPPHQLRPISRASNGASATAWTLYTGKDGERLDSTQAR